MNNGGTGTGPDGVYRASEVIVGLVCDTEFNAADMACGSDSEFHVVIAAAVFG